MSISSYDETYGIIKKFGPISLNDIGKVLVSRGVVSEDDFRMIYIHEISGHLGSLYQNKLTKKIEVNPTVSIRKISNKQCLWVVHKNVNKTPFSPSITPERKTGKERFIFKNDKLHLQLENYWQWACSDILGNAERGKLAEFIVASALGIHCETRTEWEPYDLKTRKGKKLEIKSSGYIQTWHQDKKSIIKFGIQPTKKWDEKAGKYGNLSERQSDIYIFCILAHKDPKTVNPLNLEQWEFYILKTSTLNKEKKNQKTITLNSLKKLNPIKTNYKDLPKIINGMNL